MGKTRKSDRQRIESAINSDSEKEFVNNAFGNNMKTRKPDKPHSYKKKENGKNDTGAPSLYNPDYCKDIVDYFANSPRTKQVLKAHITGKNDYTRDEYETIACELPTIGKWARSKGIADKTVYNWADEYKEFLQALDCVRGIYKDFLNDNGLAGYYNPLYTKFVATNTTDMKDKTETDVTVKTYEEISKAKKNYGI
jgi:hypothetical protein